VREIKRIIIHCSDSKDGTVESIRAMHKGKGWADIGYHKVIYPNGSVHLGRPMEQVGAHCEGHNSDSVGFCLIGVNDFSTEQIRSLVYETLSAMHTYAIDAQNVLAHYELDKKGKVCPYIPGALLRYLIRLEVPDYVKGIIP